MDRRFLAPVVVAARNAKLHADNGIVSTNAVATAKANARRRRRIESCNICMYFGHLLGGLGLVGKALEMCGSENRSRNREQQTRSRAPPPAGPPPRGAAPAALKFSCSLVLRTKFVRSMVAQASSQVPTVRPTPVQPKQLTVVLTAAKWAAFAFLPPKKSGRNNRVCH